MHAKLMLSKTWICALRWNNFMLTCENQMTIIFRPFLDFMDTFKLFTAHNMLVLMLDPWIIDLNTSGDYVGHFLAIEIASGYDSQFLVPTFKSLYLETQWMVKCLYKCCVRNCLQHQCCFWSRGSPTSSRKE